MTPNATYFARIAFTTVDQNDQEATFEAGVQHLATSFDTLVNNVTGEVIKLPLHVARNPDWYFHKVGNMFSLAASKVSQAEYTQELVRGNEGLDTDCLWRVGRLEGWLPCNTAPTYGGFTSCLSNHERIVPHRDGQPVKRTKKERGHLTGYTWHVKKAA